VSFNTSAKGKEQKKMGKLRNEKPPTLPKENNLVSFFMDALEAK